MSFNDKETLDYRTRGGIRVERRLIRQPYEGAGGPLVDALERGAGGRGPSPLHLPGGVTRRGRSSRWLMRWNGGGGCCCLPASSIRGAIRGGIWGLSIRRSC